MSPGRGIIQAPTQSTHLGPARAFPDIHVNMSCSQNTGESGKSRLDPATSHKTPPLIRSRKPRSHKHAAMRFWTFSQSPNYHRISEKGLARNLLDGRARTGVHALKRFANTLCNGVPIV